MLYEFCHFLFFDFLTVEDSSYFHNRGFQTSYMIDFIVDNSLTAPCLLIRQGSSSEEQNEIPEDRNIVLNIYSYHAKNY